jgi:hypothetical protein
MARGFIKYKAYPFRGEKDPILEVLWAIKRNKGFKDSEIKAEGGPATATLRAWWPDGKTRRPQFTTVAAAASAMGLTSLPLTHEGRQKLKGN